MASRFTLILFVFSINCYVSVSESGAVMSCVEDLPSLIAAFSSNKTSTDNILRIQETFYPQDKAAPHYVKVYYCYQEPCNETNPDYTYIWTDNPIFFVVDYHLFRALTFELADLGDIGNVSFVVPEPCNNNDTEELLLVLTKQLKSIGGTDKNLYYTRNFDELLNNQNHDYDKAKRIILAWLIIITFTCMLAAHVLIWFKGNREHLGDHLQKFVQKYVPPDPVEKTTKSKSELTFFFFIQRALFPIMVIAVCGTTAADICLFIKYRNTSSNNDKKFLYLFPVPVIALGFFIINAVMVVITSVVLYCQHILVCVSCECFLVTATLLLLFGIVYPVYHGFWMIIALLAYPGRILIGSMFIVPGILVAVPTWNILIKVIENWYQCCKDNVDNEIISFLKGLGWFVFLILDVTIWGLFIAILYYMSRFLLSSVDLENKTFQSILSFVTVSATTVIVVWLNTDLVTYQRGNHRPTQEDQEELTELK